MFKNMRGIFWIQCYKFISLFVTLRLMNFSLDIVDTFTSLPKAEIYHLKSTQVMKEIVIYLTTNIKKSQTRRPIL